MGELFRLSLGNEKNPDYFTYVSFGVSYSNDLRKVISSDLIIAGELHD